ncbi:hypothetical protein Taro_046681 [Colocasia esculenta]|uniref:Uncharacterized protein n=1 Tax=Colocasia esculenta TaxID=4460 RepID=A0A843X5V7_COLES|nr:hypothetical protein [Colocasia esculenta]
MKGKHRGRMGMIQNDGENTLLRQSEGHLWHYGAIQNLPTVEPNSRLIGIDLEGLMTAIIGGEDFRSVNVPSILTMTGM